MNIIRFREKLKTLERDNIMSKQGVDSFMNAPVFLAGSLANMTDEEVEWCEQHVLDETGRVPEHLPFDLFSILYKIEDHAEAGITDQALMVCGKPFNITRGKNYQQGIKAKCGLWSMMKVDKQDCVVTVGITGREENGMAITVHRDGKDVTKDIMENPVQSKAASEIASGLRNVMLRVVFDIMNPANIVLRVEPKSEGRSVEWVKSRTHYCILNKAHALRCSMGKRGPSDLEIERSAHWRRAHMRRLMSDKFTHKKGQLVFIKQSWVGPEEWEGSDRKIYRVINTQNKPT